MTGLHLLTATETLARLAAGTLRAAEVAEALDAQVRAREGEVRAFAWREGPPAPGRDGPLAGLHLGVKDVLDTADMPSQYGSPIWAGHRPRADAACVALARRAGLAVAGKTVTTEFATRHPGPTANPWNPLHTPGGSSSGSAAGVAAGFFHLAFATQTAGSIIRPAAYCGVHGFKPSFGTLHRAGMKVMSESLDTIGLLARSLDDIALAMRALAGWDDAPPSRRPGRAPRLALVTGPDDAAMAPETAALMQRAAEACRRAGGTVEALALPAGCRAAFDAQPHVMNREAADALAWEWDHARAQLSPVLRESLDAALARPPAALEQGRHAFAAARAALGAVLEGFDAILTPAAPGEAPEGLGWTGDPVFNKLWTALHWPCAVVPAGRGPKGLPLGLQVVARRDAACLAWAAWVEAAVA
ncbi:amidase [Roseococcus sp. DSY-14]|uniref:amidase n=1 Tax=Roseococcus sp. DSY-14 TaxID=3369650 RepID=UPI00387B7266